MKYAFIGLTLLLAGCTVDSGEHGQTTHDNDANDSSEAAYPADFMLTSYPMRGNWVIVTDQATLEGFDMDSNPDELEDQGCDADEQCPDSTHMALLHDAETGAYGMAMASKFANQAWASALGEASCDEDTTETAFGDVGAILTMIYVISFDDTVPADSLASWDQMVGHMASETGLNLRC